MIPLDRCRKCARSLCSVAEVNAAAKACAVSGCVARLMLSEEGRALLVKQNEALAATAAIRVERFNSGRAKRKTGALDAFEQQLRDVAAKQKGNER